MNLKISIITPIYNRQDCIKRCLDSVVMQQLPEGCSMEHFIVDDGSTDKTCDIVNEYSLSHPYICFHQFSENKGVNSARNYAISHCTGDYILFLDSDDYLKEDALRFIIKTISENPHYLHYLFAVNAREYYYKDNDLLKKDTAVIYYKNWIQKKVEGDFAHVIKRELLQSNLFVEELRIYEEVSLLKVMKQSEKALFTNETIMDKERGREDSVSKDYWLRSSINITIQKKALSYMINHFYDDYVQYGEEVLMHSMIKKCMFLSLADKDYGLYDTLSARTDKKFVYQIIRNLKLGKMLGLLIVFYSQIRYKGVKIK